MKNHNELRKLEAEIAGKVLVRLQANSLAQLTGEATAACRAVVTAHEGLQKAPKSGPGWGAAYDQWTTALRQVAEVIAALDRQSSVTFAIRALEKEAGQGDANGQDTD